LWAWSKDAVKVVDAALTVNDATRKDVMTDELADGGKTERVGGIGGIGGRGEERGEMAERALRVGLVGVAHGGVHT
jgi:hypothetical protein